MGSFDHWTPRHLLVSSTTLINHPPCPSSNGIHLVDCVSVHYCYTIWYLLTFSYFVCLCVWTAVAFKLTNGACNSYYGLFDISGVPNILLVCVCVCEMGSRLSLLDIMFSEGGYFKAHLIFPKEYPQRPPKMKFVTEIWHPNGEAWLLRNTLFPR